MENKFKSGFVTTDRQTECGKINTDEPSDRPEDCHHIQQAADDQKPHPDGVYVMTERGQIVFLDTPGIHKAKNKLGRVYGQCGGAHALRKWI